MTNLTSQSNETESQNEPDTAVEETKKNEFLKKYDWMLRPCDRYKGEYKECKSLRGRFQQYFVYGENLNCVQWRDDYNNCQKWSWFQNKDAALELIKSEMKRHDERMKAHTDNTTWTKRDRPPDDWNAPLPDWMEKRNENSFLAFKAQELRKEEEEERARAEEVTNQIKQTQNGVATNATSKIIATKTESVCSLM